MITVTGIIEDSKGRPISRLITFESLSTPTDEGGGIITANTTAKITSNPDDGSFTIDLRPGDYNVTYGTTPRATTFRISIPTSMDGESHAIDALIVTSFAALPGQAPFFVWNGETPFNLEFDPLDPPGDPAIGVITYTGGHITNEHYHYKVSYVTGAGETELSTGQNFPASAGANQALRLTFGAAPSGVTALRIWRNNSEAAQNTLYLLAELSPATSFYDDWESHADFSGRSSAIPAPPTFNSTSGVVYRDTNLADSGRRAFAFSKQGMFAFGDVELTDSIFGVIMPSPDGTRWRVNIANGGGINVNPA